MTIIIHKSECIIPLFVATIWILPSMKYITFPVCFLQRLSRLSESIPSIPSGVRVATRTAIFSWKRGVHKQWTRFFKVTFWFLSKRSSLNPSKRVTKNHPKKVTRKNQVGDCWKESSCFQDLKSTWNLPAARGLGTLKGGKPWGREENGGRKSGLTFFDGSIGKESTRKWLFF